MEIAVCEDNPKHREEICRKICNIMFDKEEIRIRQYEDGDLLLQHVLNKSGCTIPELIFLDIQMPKMDGMVTAYYLRKYKVTSDIVFLTAHSEYVFQGYEYHAYDYLLKPVSMKCLERTLNRYLEEKLEKKSHYLNISIRGIHHQIRLENVEYFESNGRKLIVHDTYNEDSISFYLKMDKLIELINEKEFIRCHQSYLVNKSKILKMTSGNICLLSGKQLPVSRRYKELVLAALDDKRVE